MTNTLIDPGDLSGFPGDPPGEVLVDAAVAKIRSDVGWHIAPVIEETVLARFLDSYTLALPTMRLVDVTEIRVAGQTFVPADFEFETNGIITLHGAYYSTVWNQAVEVDIEHGFESCPPELLPLISFTAATSASFRDPAVTSISVGSVSTAFSTSAGGSGASGPGGDVLARYRIPEGVA